MNLNETPRVEYRKRINAAIDFIQANLQQNPVLEEVAKAAHLSPFHFHRIFKLVVGETVADFTRRIRLEKAAGKFFYKKDRTVTQVAIELGFSSSQNLAKAFKQHFDLTPTAIKSLTSRDALQELLKQKSKNGNSLHKDGNAVNSHKHYAESSTETLNREDKAMKMTISEFAARQVIYKRLIGVYGSGIGEAFVELHRFARARQLPIAEPVYLIWDNPEITPPEKCRADACITMTDAVANVSPYNSQAIPAGTYAFVRAVVKQEREFDTAWEQLFQQILDRGYQPEDLPCFTIVHHASSDPLNGVFDVSFCAAVKPL